MSSKNWDLGLVILLATLAVIAAVIEHPLLRFFYGVPLVLCLPGYALTSLLFPQPGLTMPVRLLLCLGLSVAVAIAGGFLLNLTPWGLGAASWSLLLGGTTLAISAAAIERRRGHATVPKERLRLGLSVGQSLLAGATLAVMVSAVSVARWGAIQAPSTPFTQLWAEPVRQADGEAVQISIRNQERAMETYQLQVKVGDKIIYRWPALMLWVDQSWQRMVPVPADSPPDAPIEVQIYRADAPESVYRSVVLRRGGEE